MPYRLPPALIAGARFTAETLAFCAFMLAICTPVLLAGAATGAL
ncbi:hypothetical protein [Maricaulis sp.]